MSIPAIALCVLAAIIVGYGLLCCLGHIADPRPNDDPRDDSV